MKRLINKAATAIVAATMVFCMTACGNTASKEVGTEAGNAVVDETVYPVDITDSFGDVITLESEPERVVSVAPNLTELMYELGAGDKLVGRSDYCDYPEEVSQIESVGTLYTPDIEKIVSLEPDVVIVSTHFDEDNTAKLEEL
jgi:iron complex transport system substrate-binding protein